MSELAEIGISVARVSDDLQAYSGALHAISERIRQLAAGAAHVVRSEGHDMLRATQVARSLEMAAIQCSQAAGSLESASRAARLFVVRNIATGAASGNGLASAGQAPTEPVLLAGGSQALDDYTGSGFRAMNRALWGNEPLNPEVAARIVAVSKALRQLPDFQGQVLRGTTLDDRELAHYVPGRVLTHHAFISADRVKPFKGNVMFVIQSKHGKSVRKWSRWKESEDEVIFDRATRFLVLDRWIENGVNAVNLAEVD